MTSKEEGEMSGTRQITALKLEIPSLQEARQTDKFVQTDVED